MTPGFRIEDFVEVKEDNNQETMLSREEELLD